MKHLSFKKALLLFLTILTCDTIAFSQTKQYTYETKGDPIDIIYPRYKTLRIKLLFEEPDKKYFIKIYNVDESKESPEPMENDKPGIFTAGLSKAKFFQQVSKLIMDNSLLVLSDDADENKLRINKFFEGAGFTNQIEKAYEAFQKVLVSDAASKPSIKKPLKAKEKKKDSGNEKINIAEADKEASTSDDEEKNTSILNRITVLTAANFDFSSKLSTSYLGLFNIFAPNDSKELYKWGWMLGIARINYNNANINNNDSVSSSYVYQNIVKPFDYFPNGDSVRIGAEYHNQFNKITYTRKNTVWSFYANPLIKIHQSTGTDDNFEGVYLHGHFELLVNQYTRSAIIETLADSLRTNVVQRLDNVILNPLKNLDENYNFLSGYFGFGATIYLRPFKNDSSTHIFLQPTFGFAINTPNFDLLNAIPLVSSRGLYRKINPVNNFAKPFYLIKVTFFKDISSNSQLMVGFSSRGFFPTNNPQYTAFAGLNVGISALTNLFSSNK